MLQSDNDRWPLWDQEFDETEGEQAEAGENRAEAKRSTEHRTTDKKISIGEGKRPQSVKSPSGDAWKYSTIGTELLAAVLIGTLIGWAISRYIGGGPWAITAGVLIGAAAGLLNLYRIIVELEQKEEQERRGSSR
ncbi:MAG TPA: AtpZ/AtpI family protein [Anaerolineae bacterium]|jgi:F0F1-type ATP synthase assembly protein I|nr:AtpZ/AtpI family protein [Anaerolineae bacterium]